MTDFLIKAQLPTRGGWADERSITVAADDVEGAIGQALERGFIGKVNSVQRLPKQRGSGLWDTARGRGKWKAPELKRHNAGERLR